MACEEVSLEVPSGTFYLLLGKPESGKTSLARCILGERKPRSGRVLVFGEDPRRARRRRKIAALRSETPLHPWWRFWIRPARTRSSPQETFETTLHGRPDLLVIDDWPLPDGSLERLAAEVERGLTVFLAASSPPKLAPFAGRVGILVEGRLVLDEDAKTLSERFRRIRYVSQITETRTEYGNELEEFEAVRVRARGWGVEAIVSNFTEEAFERFRRLDGVEEARAETLSLAEIFESLR